MKILAILGSPRKGNTFAALARVEEIMKSQGEVDFEYLLLKDADLKPCLGCFRCVRLGHENCPLKDDKAAILGKMLSAAGLIIASPAYNYNITALLKNFVDRFAHIGHRPLFFGQHLMIVATTAGVGLSQVTRYLKDFIGMIWGFRSITRLGVMASPFSLSKGQIARDDRALEKAARRFALRLGRKRWSPRFHHLDQFCLMRSLWSREEMKEAFPADHALYTSLRKRKFYFDAEVNPVLYALASLKARLLGALVMTSIEKKASDADSN